VRSSSLNKQTRKHSLTEAEFLMKSKTRAKTYFICLVRR